VAGGSGSVCCALSEEVWCLFMSESIVGLLGGIESWELRGCGLRFFLVGKVVASALQDD
jgi:hypothetical protein